MVGATMLASTPLEKPVAGPQQADVRVVAAIPPPEPGDFKSVLRVEGMTKIAKLGQAMSIGRGKFKALIKAVDDDRPNPLIGELLMPPAPGYFVVFRFMPVTNNTSFVQVGDATGSIDLTDLTKAKAIVKVKLNLVISEVKQNGVPLDVGPNCHTVTPVDLDLSGTINLGVKAVTETQPVTEANRAGTIETRYAIPAFTGCGVTENLSPLMTGLVSGPGNELITHLYNLCFGTNSCNPYW
ncbi:hypothetical protein SAMN05421871_11782 [Actinokineospora alba]|nr:hypothetical protein C8E96_5572 [Actinokineospora alba]SDJ50766.1 hypothetical protein SAMN05421871_11782 [Actinokineospora alba]